MSGADSGLVFFRDDAAATVPDAEMWYIIRRYYRIGRPE